MFGRMSSEKCRSTSMPVCQPALADILGIAFWLGLAAIPAAGAQVEPSADNRPVAQASEPLIAQMPSFAPLVKRVMPAVVNVEVSENPSATTNGDADLTPFEEFLRRFYEQQGEGGLPSLPGRRVSLGAGFIIDNEGYIVTDSHVIAHAGKIIVTFQDGTKHPAREIGRDSLTDLGLLKIENKEPLPYVAWGDSDAIQVGDWVLAAGNPFGLGGTVSPGTISARGRDIRIGPYDDFLQIDASLNRGNSGGPTFNLAGEVVGIVTAIYSPSGGSVGVGFATPSNLAKPVIQQLKEHGRVDRSWLGVQIQEVTEEIAQALDLPKVGGALVADVADGGPAAKAGVKTGDVILSFNGHVVDEMRHLPFIVAQTPAGEKATIELWRSAKTLSLDITVAPLPEEAHAAQVKEENKAEPKPQASLGLTLAPLNPDLRKRLDIAPGTTGVVVTALAENSPFIDTDLELGDIIVSVNQQPVGTPQQVMKLLHAAQSAQRKSLLLINRRGASHYIVLESDNGSGGKAS
jgi:serine protease Do